MFTEERIGEILRQLKDLCHPLQVPLAGWQMQDREQESRPGPGRETGCWKHLPADGIWGGHCRYLAFRCRAVVPETFAGCPVEFALKTGKEGEWDATNPQFTVYVDGALRQGFDVNHETLRLTDCAAGGETYDLFLSAFTGVQNFHLTFEARLQTVELSVEKLYYDLLIPWQTACLLQPDDPAYLELTALLTEAVNDLDLRKPGSAAFLESVQKADALVTERLYTQQRSAEAIIRCVGHTHIDVAWLWTLAVTRDKAVRSFSTVLELMRRYPEYIFMSSQPQLYQYVKESAPEIFEEIKKRVAEGRWEPEGGMFVEPDCNLSSGEALVRQFLYGKRFFRQEFGRDNRILWLPDVFGYSAALPQIMKKCGVDYFMTTKISWNECNKLPYDTFYWKGIDGTKVLTHFIPTRDYVAQGRSIRSNNEFTTAFSTNYNGMIVPAQMKGAWQRYQQKDLNREVLCSYGFGDGGGGPTAEMLETQRRLSWGIPGCPATRQSTALAFFEQLRRDLAGKRVPVWTGELYLEYHRGTYTSMARNKKWNRRGEFALTNAETESLLAAMLCGRPYDQQGLRAHWEILLRNQFHDILPGSAIEEVYEDSREEYAHLFAYTSAVERETMQQVADRVGGPVVWNPNGQTMSGLAELPEPMGLQHVQRTENGWLAWAGEVPSKGFCRLEDRLPDGGPVTVTAAGAETPFAKLTFNEQGWISSWYDKQGQRELLQPGQCGNVLMTYEDKPHKYDNWNLFDYYREKSWPVEKLLSSEVTEQGPLRWTLRQQWQYQDSVITEELSFYGHTPRVDIRFMTDWKEDQIFLKALFPVALNTAEAVFEIQYGNVRRSTAVNTSWDAARFEVCCHKWMDVAEGGFGVSFLNDCKYGVSVEENVVGLSLLKCGRDPNPRADREYHEAVYSVLPHPGSWQEAGTVAEAYLLNNPLQVYQWRGAGDGGPLRCSLAEHSCRNIMVESVKQAEDSEDVVIRLYEFENRQTEVELKLGRRARKVWLCNLLEEPEQLLAEHTDRVTVPVAPFEIVSLRLEG